jgi:hypothetical protein
LKVNPAATAPTWMNVGEKVVSEVESEEELVPEEESGFETVDEEASREVSEGGMGKTC